MAGQTGRGYFFGEGRLKGTMGIGVTGETLLQGVVRLARVTELAGRDDFHLQGRVPLMAVEAGNLGLVRPTGLGNIQRSCFVAKLTMLRV